MADLVNRERIGGSVKKEYAKGLDDLHEKTRIPKSRLLDEALELLFEKHNFEIKIEE